MPEGSALPRALVFSLLLHAGLFAFLHYSPNLVSNPDIPQVMQVQLIQAEPEKQPAPEPKPAPKPKPKLEPTQEPTQKPKPKPVKTQASAAPKEPPKTAPTPPQEKPNSVKAVPPPEESPNAEQEQPAPKQPDEPDPADDTTEQAKRPAKLDKTPDKTVVKSEEPDARTVTEAEADDFLDALAFAEKLEEEQELKPQQKPVADPAPAPVDSSENEPLIAIEASEVKNRLRRHIEKHWYLPPGLGDRGLQVRAAVRVAKDGRVEKVTITQSSGNPAYDNSLQRAILKASPLPIPSENNARYRVLDVGFQK